MQQQLLVRWGGALAEARRESPNAHPAGGQRLKKQTKKISVQVLRRIKVLGDGSAQRKRRLARLLSRTADRTTKASKFVPAACRYRRFLIGGTALFLHVGAAAARRRIRCGDCLCLWSVLCLSLIHI